MTLERVAALAEPAGLFVMGTCHSVPDDQSLPQNGTLVLLGMNNTSWSAFETSGEYQDTQAHPLDRWSKRIIGAIAQELRATPSYPSDGPPYAPFIQWALNTGRFFQSPTGMMIHDVAGLMISIRGALLFDTKLDIAAVQSTHPCDTCRDQPCVAACPVDALSDAHAYDVPSCKTYLNTSAGQDCMTQGCAVRRACPISQSFDRSPAQSAFHMAAFKG